MDKTSTDDDHRDVTTITRSEATITRSEATITWREATITWSEPTGRAKHRSDDGEGGVDSVPPVVGGWASSLSAWWSGLINVVKRTWAAVMRVLGSNDSGAE